MKSGNFIFLRVEKQIRYKNKTQTFFSLTYRVPVLGMQQAACKAYRRLAAPLALARQVCDSIVLSRVACFGCDRGSESERRDRVDLQCTYMYGARALRCVHATLVHYVHVKHMAKHCWGPAPST